MITRKISEGAKKTFPSFTRLFKQELLCALKVYKNGNTQKLGTLRNKGLIVNLE